MQILFFASLRERLNSDGERWTEVPDQTSVSDIINTLRSRGQPWEDALDRQQLLVAVNQEMASYETIVQYGDELAFFPPVTGG